MKGFKTYIITKKTLLKIFIYALSLFIIAIVIFSFNIRHKSVSVFSDFAENIIDEGTVSDKSKYSLKEIEKKILGFDKDNAQSIIKSSSSGFENSFEKEILPSPSPSPEAVVPATVKSPLLPHDKIVNSIGIKVNNNTDYNIDIDNLCNLPLEINLDFKTPEVLIVHTHTTECYDGDEMTGETGRTTNEAYNMCRLGDVVADVLEENNIKTIHNKTIHDYPSYQGAYTRAMKTIENVIKENPSIKVVIDIHRDAYVYPDGEKLKVSTDINNQSAAQVMLVLGTDSMGLEHSHWQSNLAFAAKIHNAAQIMYPNLMRPLNLRRERFNMHLTTGSILIEIGSNGNTLDEAVRSAEYIGNAIASVLING